MSFKLTIGKVSRLGMPAFHNEAVVAITPNTAEYDDYLFTFLPLLATGGVTNAAIKGRTLNSRSLTGISVPIPPVEDVGSIVAAAERLNAALDRLGAAVSNEQRTLSTLTIALLARLIDTPVGSEARLV